MGRGRLCCTRHPAWRIARCPVMKKNLPDEDSTTNETYVMYHCLRKTSEDSRCTSVQQLFRVLVDDNIQESRITCALSLLQENNRVHGRLVAHVGNWCCCTTPCPVSPVTQVRKLPLAKIQCAVGKAQQLEEQWVVCSRSGRHESRPPRSSEAQ